MDAATNSATRHFYKPEPRQSSMPLQKPIQQTLLLVFRAAQLRGTYSMYEDEDERVTTSRVSSQLDVFQHSDSSLGTNDNNNNNNNSNNSNNSNNNNNNNNNDYDDDARGGQKKIEEADLLNTHDWLNTKCKFQPWIHRAYNNMSKEGEFTVQHKLPPKYKDDNHFKQDWFMMGIYTQLMTNHRPEWVDDKPTWCHELCFHGAFISSFLLNHGKAQVPSAAKPLGIAKATNICALQKSVPLRAWRRSYFNKFDAKTTQQESSTWAEEKTQEESSDNTTLSWNSPPFNADSPSSPTTAATDQLCSVEEAVVTAEKEKRRRGTRLNPTHLATEVRWRSKNSIN
eukprot:jgi/Psemu1/22854/gm1.22854_g